MKYTGPKIKLSRRLGFALTPKAGKYLERRSDPPGVHGKRRKSAKLSDYGRQLLEKQRLRFQYNISEKQLQNCYQKAVRKKGNTADILIQLLESRLDALVLRAGFARTIYAARQLVNHGHVQVNGSARTDFRQFRGVGVRKRIAIEDVNGRVCHVMRQIERLGLVHPVVEVVDPLGG